MAGDETRPILCGKCNVRAEVAVKADGGKDLVFPSCGERDELDHALGKAVEYNARDMIGGMFKGFGPGSNITVKSAPNPRPRFILG